MSFTSVNWLCDGTLCYIAGCSHREPIAVVGLSCAFAGAASAEQYWRALTASIDGLETVTAPAPNTAVPERYVARGGWLPDNTPGLNTWDEAFWSGVGVPLPSF